jgi:predicted ribosomally synthesized peptide with SipW-like signal peptide
VARPVTAEVWNSTVILVEGKMKKILGLTLAALLVIVLVSSGTWAYFSDTENSRGKLIMPCGTGKSLTSYWIAEVLNARSILVAVPSLALIRQSLDVWTRESIANKRDIDWICVCSDETVSDIERDDAVRGRDLDRPGATVHLNVAFLVEPSGMNSPSREAS